MKKKLISLAVAGAFAGYGAAASAATVSGFVDIYYTLADDAAEKASTCAPTAASSCQNDTEGKFTANAEIDVIHQVSSDVTVRVDTDLALTKDATSGDAASLEQAFFAWDLAPVTVIAGVFNNPIGQEAEDVTDWNFVQGSMIRASLDHQTSLHGNNVTGAAVAGAVGPVTLTGALLNHLGEANDENSLALLANFSPIPGLDLELGMVTQESETNGNTAVGNVENVGDVMNFNVQWAPAPVPGLNVGLDYASYDEIVDTAYNLWGTFAIPGTDFSLGVRMEELSWVAYGGGTAATDVERTSFNVAYQAAPNLLILLEVTDGEGAGCLASDPTPTPGTGCDLDFDLGAGNTASDITGVRTDAFTQIEFVATF